MKKLMKVRYLMLAIMCMMYFIAYIDRVNISIVAPLLKDDMALTPTQLGLVFSAFAYPYAAMQILGGWFADKFGPRLVLGVLSVIWAAATILCGFSWGLSSLIIFRILLGIGEGGAFPAATRSFTYWMPTSERGFAQGITHSFARLGGAVTPPIVLFIVSAYGWRESFMALGVVSIIWTIFFVFLFRNTPLEHKWIKPEELKEIGVNSSEMKKAASGKTPWAQMFKRMWLVTFVDFCYGWSLWVFLTWLPSYLKDVRGYDMKHLALFTALPLLAGVVGDTLGGVASDFIYKKTGNLKLARRALLVIGLGGALAFIMPAIYTRTPLTAVILLSASFFCLELTNAVLWSLPIDIAGKYAGTAGGMMNTGFGIAGMISPAVFGFLIQKTGSYEVPFLISGGLLGIAALCSLRIDPTDKVKDEETVVSVPIPEGRVVATGN
jgi:ACS family D-galactonate transporter-like MFS transporter